MYYCHVWWLYSASQDATITTGGMAATNTGNTGVMVNIVILTITVTIRITSITQTTNTTQITHRVISTPRNTLVKGLVSNGGGPSRGQCGT